MYIFDIFSYIQYFQTTIPELRHQMRFIWPQYTSFFDWISSQPDIIDTNILTYSNLYSLTNLTNMNSIQSINNAVNETEHIINQYGNGDTEWDFVFSTIGKSATNNDPNGQNAAI